MARAKLVQDFPHVYLVAQSELPFWSDIPYGRLDKVKAHWGQRAYVTIDREYLEPLGFACRYGRYEIVRWLVEEQGQNVNGGEDERFMPLFNVSLLVPPLGEPFDVQAYIDCFVFLVGHGARRGLECVLPNLFHNMLCVYNAPPIACLRRMTQVCISHGARLSHYQPCGRSPKWRKYGKAWYEMTCQEVAQNHEMAKGAVMTVLGARKYRRGILAAVPRDVLLVIVRNVWESRHCLETWGMCKKKRRRVAPTRFGV